LDGFVPPFPPRHAGRLPLPELLRRARRNFLEVWSADQFAQEVISTRVLARPILVCNSPATVQAAFIDGAAALERKSPQMRHALEPLLGDGLFISDGLVWRERRRAVAPVTHASRLAELAPAMTEAAAERAAAWAALPPGAPVDMLAQMGELAAEVICRTLFGRRLGAGAAREVVAAFARYQAGVPQIDPLSLFGLPDWVPRPRPWRLRAEVRRIHAVVDRLIGAVMARRGDGASVVGAMAAAGMDARACRNEAVTLFMAGHETSANAMAWAWFLLSQAPGAAARLRAEAGAALGGRAATWEDLPRLPFARAVVEETLRLYPPVPLLARSASAPLAIGGRPVPRGALVLVVPWLLHRNPLLWEEPDRFLPERFLAGRPPRHAYVPFSLGPRVCTGAQFALAETVICLSTLAQRFAPRLAPGAGVAPVCRLTLRPGGALPMLLDRAPGAAAAA
jgi:cytochrome P450